jgi:hypothetical protein
MANNHFISQLGILDRYRSSQRWENSNVVEESSYMEILCQLLSSQVSLLVPFFLSETGAKVLLLRNCSVFLSTCSLIKVGSCFSLEGDIGDPDPEDVRNCRQQSYPPTGSTFSVIILTELSVWALVSTRPSV